MATIPHSDGRGILWNSPSLVPWKGLLLSLFPLHCLLSYSRPYYTKITSVSSLPFLISFLLTHLWCPQHPTFIVYVTRQFDSSSTCFAQEAIMDFYYPEVNGRIFASLSVIPSHPGSTYLGHLSSVIISFIGCLLWHRALNLSLD